MELNEVVHEMHVIATVPDLYHVLVDLNAVQSLLQLLNHDNTGTVQDNGVCLCALCVCVCMICVCVCVVCGLCVYMSGRKGINHPLRSSHD